jgi:hypothetical protein
VCWSAGRFVFLPAATSPSRPIVLMHETIVISDPTSHLWRSPLDALLPAVDMDVPAPRGLFLYSLPADMAEASSIDNSAPTEYRTADHLRGLDWLVQAASHSDNFSTALLGEISVQGYIPDRALLLECPTLVASQLYASEVGWVGWLPRSSRFSSDLWQWIQGKTTTALFGTTTFVIASIISFVIFTNFRNSPPCNCRQHLVL